MAENANAFGVQANQNDILSNNTDNSNNSTNVNKPLDVDVNNAKDNVGNTNVNKPVDVDVDNSKDNVGNNYSDNSNNSDNSNSSDNSTNVGVDVDVDVDVDNSTWDQDNSDNSIDVDKYVNSFNDNSDNSVNLKDSCNDNSVHNKDSFNVTSSFNTQTLNDDSVTVGVRQYASTFGTLNLGGLFGGAAAGAGALSIDNRSSVVDQSVNQAISAQGSGGVGQAFSQSAVVSSGDGSVAAGQDAALTNLDFNFTVGDVAIGNTAIATSFADSFNDQSAVDVTKINVEFDKSFNQFTEDYDSNVEFNESFNSDWDAYSDSFNDSSDNSANNAEWNAEWNNEGNIFSPGANVAGDDILDVL